ncbi:general transcription factor 3C polypeptide 1 [Stomoxys calcitrans]|uniref:general transcription factor 3C polypeptide 1 n=1 Tax=Stomoxys calcitrans TaxID=35570 RepID=UPI0027E244AD|nr:general transcription factor 3C polypeptide 1 [Stomoxys calcitrans]
MDPSSNRGTFQRLILDEIALEGLEGVTLSSLWMYLAKCMKLPLPLPQSLRSQIWAFILRMNYHLQFYELPVERKTVVLFDRYLEVDTDLGVPIIPENCPAVRYKCAPISDGDILGSCEYYKERKLIPYNQLKDLSDTDVDAKWGGKFVIVASQELRYNAITPENVPRPKELTAVQYVIWEAIGRARYNGETTSGTWSLTHYCKDSTIVFYIKNKLLRHGVIVSQLFNEKRGERLTVTTLLTLPRFYNTKRSRLLTMVEKLFLMLKEKPDNTMPLIDVRSVFPSFERQKSLKKAMLTHLFRKIFETRSVPYKDIYPNTKSKDTGSARTVTMVRLRHPEKSMDDLFENMENEHDKSEDNTGEDFHNERHAYVDMPLREEFYQCVARYGNRGCSQTEIYRHMACHHLTLRQLVKQMVSEGLIRSYCQDVGRQRVNMYVAVEHSDSVNKKVKMSMDVLQSLRCDEEPNLPIEEAQYKDIPQITARIKPHEYQISGAAAMRDNRSHRLVCRKAFAVKMINEKCILPVLVLRKLLQVHEKELGLKDEICQKSIRRMLCHMNKSGIVNVYEIVLQCDENIRIHRYVTHPKIDIDHFIIKNEILKLKNNFYLTIEEKRMRLIAALRFQSKKLKANTKKLKAAEIKLAKTSTMPLKPHKPPKFLISRFLHEFLFYIVVELNELQSAIPITKELLEHWQIDEPSIRVSEYLQQMQEESLHVRAFTKEISWRTFIPPLPRYSDKPAGWVYFIDAIDRMPLSIFNKIFHIDKGADECLTSYLSHPIKQHYLMRQLPSELQCKIARVQLQKVYISVLKLLNHMGLIQVGDKLSVKDPLVMWIFLNRKARVLDTTNTEPAYLCVNADREYTPITFDLKTFEDIHQYWTTLQRVCVYTKLGFRSRSMERNERSRELVFLNPVDYDEAPQHDVGYQPGDSLGAAGLSSYLFAHTFRNWSWSVQSSKKITVRNVRTNRGASSSTLVRNKVLRVNARKTRQYSTIKRTQVQKVPALSKKDKKTAPRDAIDRDALKNMRTLRVSWSKAEDEVLMMGKATFIYISAPVPSLGLLAQGKVCRDIIRQSLGIYNKTTQACCRRLQFVIRQKRHIPQVPSWLHMLQTNEFMQKKYGDMFLQKLKKVYTSRSEFTDALLIHYTLIICHLYKLVTNSQDIPAKSRFLLPDSIHEFRKRFVERVTVQAEDDVVVYKNPETNQELQIMVVLNVLHSTLCAFRDKTLYNLQAFEIYKNFSEDVLKTAFFKARSDCLAVAIKRQNINLFTNQLSGPAYVLSSKYRLKLLFLRIPYGVYDAAFEFYERAMQYFFGVAPSSSSSVASKEHLELKSPTLGQFFVIAEGLARSLWDINIKLPINILTVDAEQNQTVNSMDRILDHYHSIFDNAPQQEYSKAIDNESQQKQIRVKFHPANLSYKINYSPYDLISKLPTRYLHFFCALDYMDQEIEINFSKLQYQDDEGHMVIECPFKCIFKSEDYLNEICRIVNEKKSVLNSLTEMAPQKLLNLATSGLSIKVYTSNLLTLVRMLESFWYEKESQHERKDLGKHASQLKTTKTIDWSELCHDILKFHSTSEDDYDKIDEYEPTLNKEERVVRAQDVFVVNLPTIQIKTTKDLLEDTDTLVLSDGRKLPKQLVFTEQQKEAVLKKVLDESYWKYTNNNLCDVKNKLKDYGFSDMEQKHLEEMYEFIEKRKLGASILDLLKEFPYEQFLLKALNFLSAEYLVKRVGVAHYVYVHKNHMRSWVVQTFNLKRLDRENMGSTTATIKRTYNEMACGDQEEDNNSEVPSKKPHTETNAATSEEQSNTEVQSAGTSKRIPKPVNRFDPAQNETVGVNVKDREVIVMRPVPWIRLNGSINRRVLDRWLGSILCECIARNGCSVQEVCIRFTYMYPVDVMFLLEVLQDLGCLHLTQMHRQEVDIFSQYQSLKETPVPFTFDPENTFIHIHGDAAMRLYLFIGKKKYAAEFV